MKLSRTGSLIALLLPGAALLIILNSLPDSAVSGTLSGGEHTDFERVTFYVR